VNDKSKKWDTCVPFAGLVDYGLLTKLPPEQVRSRDGALVRGAAPTAAPPITRLLDPEDGQPVARFHCAKLSAMMRVDFSAVSLICA
jgi:hypothetical protein